MNSSHTNRIKPMMAPISDQQSDNLHNASLRILSTTGLNVHSPELRAMLKKAGAKVSDELRVYIPPELVEQALSTAPSRIDIYDRNNSIAMRLEGTNIYFGTGSDLQFTSNGKTGNYRKSTLNDVALAARLCDKLKNIDFVMSYALPSDLPEGRCETEQLQSMLDNTRKPIIMTTYSSRERLTQIHEVACKSCGGESAFRKSPNYIMYGQFVSPLQHDSDALDRLIFCADHAIPLIYIATIMMGVSGPVTLAGALALANAECLAGLVMHQLRAPGAPFIYGGCVSPLDMKTAVFSYGTPEWRLADMVFSQLSLRYDLPIFGTAGATDAKVIDAQAGAEWAYSLLVSALAGTNIIHDVGYMASGMTGSLEALVVCDETIGMVKRFMAGFEIDKETLALDVTNRVGPAGHFVEDKHTILHFRSEVWYPSLFNREGIDAWREKNMDLLTLAREHATDIISAYDA